MLIYTKNFLPMKLNGNLWGLKYFMWKKQSAGRLPRPRGFPVGPLSAIACLPETQEFGRPNYCKMAGKQILAGGMAFYQNGIFTFKGPRCDSKTCSRLGYANPVNYAIWWASGKNCFLGVLPIQIIFAMLFYTIMGNKGGKIFGFKKTPDVLAIPFWAPSWKAGNWP